MWWSSMVKAVPFLLAASLDTVSKSTPTKRTTTKNSPPSSIGDLSKGFFEVYKDLERPGPISDQVTPTLRFSYVTPTVHGASTWRTMMVDDDVPAESKPGQNNKPIAIMLPGLDGYGISASSNQYDDLADNFEFWRLTIQPEDRSSFAEIVDAVAAYVANIEDKAGDRPIVLIGESCGGLIAAAAALRLQRNHDKSPLDGLVLINPATSFDRTNWDALVPLLASLDLPSNSSESGVDELTAYDVIGSLILSALIPDSNQIQRIFEAIVNLPGVQIPPRSTEQLQEIMTATVEGFKGTGDKLPGTILEHRVKWLTLGAPVVNARLPELKVQTLVVVGLQDKLLPSANEGDRLVRIMPNSEKLEVRQRGHFVLDNNVNLTEAILFSKIDPLNWKATKKAYDVVTDWKLPSSDKIKAASESVAKTFRTALSPVFVSTDKNGKRWMGLSKVPKVDGPVLFVGNHQFAGADLQILFAELYEERGIVARGLAHPVVFTMSMLNELGGRIPGLVDNLNRAGDLQEFGALPVTPRNYYRLMQSGQTGLLFPGGAKEALSGRKDYPLFWPTKVDFVRTAAKFNATIIPVSAIGMLDSVNVLAETDYVLKLPFIGERARKLTQNATAARYDKRNEDEVLLPPIAIPTIPARNYFVFGTPVSTNDVDPKDKEACSKVYRQTKDEVRRGIDDLLRAREQDPFKDTPQRLVYERLFNKKAPTFPIDELN